MRMSRLTPEGRVIFALWGAPARFGELKTMTGLSGAWLNRALKRLYAMGLIEHDVASKMYTVKKTEQLQTQIDALMPVYLSEVANMVAGGLAGDMRVQAVILFGSVAMGKATWGSDIDLLVVLEKFNDDIENEFNLELSELGFKFGVRIEPTLSSREDFEAMLEANVGLKFGLARGHEVLYDRTSGHLTKLLEESVAKVKDDYTFIQEGEVWLPKRELTVKA